MESLSALDLGASLAQHNKSFSLEGLAAKARRLADSNLPTKLRSGNESTTSSDSKSQELMDVAKKFEAILIHQMFKAMRKTVQKSELLNSFSMQQYESMMDEQIANEMAKHKGIGLADTLFYQLSRLENASNTPAIESN